MKKIELKNKSIALNVLSVPDITEKIRRAYKSKYNKPLENQVTLLMIMIVNIALSCCKKIVWIT